MSRRAGQGGWGRLSPTGVIGAIAALGAAVAVVLAVVGGGGGDGDGTARIAREDTLVLGYFLPPTGKVGNPYLQAGDNLVSDGVWQLVFEPLFYFNYERGRLEPWLATGYEYADGNRTIALHLRDDVRWGDGEPFGADDVVFTLKRLVAARAPLRAANIQSSVRSVRKVSPSEVTIRLKAPNPRFV